MNYKTCLILALVALTGCSTMHSTTDHTGQPPAPAASSSPSNATATPTKVDHDAQDGADDSINHDVAVKAQQPKPKDQSGMGMASKNEPEKADADSGSEGTAGTAPQAGTKVEAESMPEPSVTVAKEAQQVEKSATTANSPIRPEPVAKATPKPRAKPQPKPAPKPAQLAITGSLQLAASAGQQTSSADYTNTVIYFVPDHGSARPKPGTFTVYTSHRDFSPSWLVVPLGSKVTFTNLDTVKHNVFSVTPGSRFDLGYQSANQSITHSFTRAGLVLLSCHVHRAMRGDILVVPSRYATTARSNGRFAIRNVPDVAGTLYFWNPRSRRSSSSKVQPPFASIRQKIAVSKPSVASKIGIGK